MTLDGAENGGIVADTGEPGKALISGFDPKKKPPQGAAGVAG